MLDYDRAEEPKDCDSHGPKDGGEEVEPERGPEPHSRCKTERRDEANSGADGEQGASGEDEEETLAVAIGSFDLIEHKDADDRVPDIGAGGRRDECREGDDLAGSAWACVRHVEPPTVQAKLHALGWSATTEGQRTP